jgi:hypothetical protein
LFIEVVELSETEIPNGHTRREVILDAFEIAEPYV